MSDKASPHDLMRYGRTRVYHLPHFSSFSGMHLPSDCFTLFFHDNNGAVQVLWFTSKQGAAKTTPCFGRFRRSLPHAC